MWLSYLMYFISSRDFYPDPRTIYFGTSDPKQWSRHIQLYTTQAYARHLRFASVCAHNFRPPTHFHLLTEHSVRVGTATAPSIWLRSPLNVRLHTVFTRSGSSEAKLLVSRWYRSLENIIEAVGFCAHIIFDEPNSALHCCPFLHWICYPQYAYYK